MKINALRASTIGRYDDCPFAFYLEYVCGLSALSGKKASLGTCVHLVAQLLAQAKKVGRDKYPNKYTDPKFLLDVCWPRHLKDNSHHSYDQKDYEFCEKMVKIILESDINPLSRKILNIEHQFEIQIQKPGFAYDYFCSISSQNKSGHMMLRGTIDLITEVDEETIEVIDYKTGERKSWTTGEPKELEDFYDDTQLLLYNLATHKLYPDYKHRLFTIVYVRDGGPFTVTFTEEDIAKAIDRLRRKFNEIRADDDPKRLKDDKSRKDAWKCRYVCHYGKTKDERGVSQCDKYFSILKNNGIEEATKILYGISIEGKSLDSISRRNDYGREGISRATIK